MGTWRLVISLSSITAKVTVPEPVIIEFNSQTQVQLHVHQFVNSRFRQPPNQYWRVAGTDETMPGIMYRIKQK